MKRVLKWLWLALPRLAVASGLLFFMGVGWFVWELHPWVLPGRAFALGRWHFGEYDFQVWQRKNEYTLEPFADGLFVRRGTNGWEAFCFDIQDSWSPKVRLEKRDSVVVLYRSGEQRGVFDMRSGTFQRHEQPFDPVIVTGEPPGSWWLKESRL